MNDTLEKLLYLTKQIMESRGLNVKDFKVITYIPPLDFVFVIKISRNDKKWKIFVYDEYNLETQNEIIRQINNSLDFFKLDKEWLNEKHKRAWGFE